MAVSKCIKCDGTAFEVQLKEPHGALFKLLFVQCQSCGAVVGVTESRGIGRLVEALAKKLGHKLD